MAPFDTSAMITFWIPLQDIAATGGGGLVFCSKSHADFALPFWNDYHAAASEDDSPWHHLDERYSGGGTRDAVVDYMPLAVGDVTVHSGWTLHCADAVEHDRLALAVTFVSARAAVRADAARSSSRRGDAEDAWSYRDWVHEVPSDTFEWDHPLVPIVWPPTTTTGIWPERTPSRVSDQANLHNQTFRNYPTTP